MGTMGFHSFDNSLTKLCCRSNFEVNSHEIDGLTGHWTMEDGYDNVEDPESSIYPFRVFTYAFSLRNLIRETLLILSS